MRVKTVKYSLKICVCVYAYTMINCYSKLKFDGTIGSVFSVPFFLPTAFYVARSLSLLPALSVDLCFPLRTHRLKEKQWELMLDFPI